MHDLKPTRKFRYDAAYINTEITVVWSEIVSILILEHELNITKAQGSYFKSWYKRWFDLILMLFISELIILPYQIQNFPFRSTSVVICTSHVNTRFWCVKYIWRWTYRNVMGSTHGSVRWNPGYDITSICLCLCLCSHSASHGWYLSSREDLMPTQNLLNKPILLW